MELAHEEWMPVIIELLYLVSPPREIHIGRRTVFIDAPSALWASAEFQNKTARRFSGSM